MRSLDCHYALFSWFERPKFSRTFATSVLHLLIEIGGDAEPNIVVELETFLLIKLFETLRKGEAPLVIHHTKISER